MLKIQGVENEEVTAKGGETKDRHITKPDTAFVNSFDSKRAYIYEYRMSVKRQWERSSKTEHSGDDRWGRFSSTSDSSMTWGFQPLGAPRPKWRRWKLGNQTKLTEHELKAQLSSTYTTVTDFPLSMLYTRLPSSYVQMLSILQCNINHVISHALQ